MLDLGNITFAVLLTGAGVLIAAGIVSLVVDVLKAGVPALANVNGMTMAFVISAVLYVLAGIAVGVGSLDGGLSVFLAWLSCAAASLGLHKTILGSVSNKITGT